MSTLNRYTLFLLRETRNLMRITLSANKKQIGLVRFSTPKLNSIYPTTAYLHKIEVAESHRNARIGSRLLTQMDDYLKIVLLLSHFHNVVLVVTEVSPNPAKTKMS